MKKRVFSIIFLMLLSIYIGSATIKAAPPEDINYNAILELLWSNSSTITEGGEYHLVDNEIDGSFKTIPAIAEYSLTAVMGNIVAYNGVGAIYPGHSVAYEYYIFMVDQEELHFYDFKWSYKAKVPFDELVSVTTDDPFVGDNTVSIQYMVDDEQYDLQIVNKGSQLTLPEDPEKENHVFIGWYSDPLFYYAYDPTTIVVNGFQLYAKFQLEDLTINFYNGEELYLNKSVIYGTKIQGIITDPSINSYSKTIYNPSISSGIFYPDTNILNLEGVEWKYHTNINGDKIRIAPGKTLVSLQPFSSIKSITVKTQTGRPYVYGDVAVSKDGEIWTSYRTSFSSGVIEYTHNVNKSGPLFIKVSNTDSSDYFDLISLKITINAETETGKKHIFDKWYYDTDLTLPYHEDDIFISDTNLYAGYVEKQYELSFDSNDGSPVTSQFYYEDDEIIMPEYNPSRIGYVFAGWYLDEELEEEFNLETMPGEDVTLYAKWVETEETQFLIEFYLDEELYTYIVLAEEQELILPSAPPTAENQIFLGWYYDEEFTEQFKVTDPIEDDVTLYGKFGSGGSGGTETPPEETPRTEFKLEKKYVIIAAIVFIGIGLALIIRKRK